MSTTTIPEYDPATCITAGELRAVGLQMPWHIPDCGWVPRRAMLMVPATTTHSDDDIMAGVMRIDVSVTFTEPFRWINFECVITKKEQQP